MATDITKIRGDQWSVAINDVVLEGVVASTFPDFDPTRKTITGLDTGPTALGELVNGHEGEITIDVQERHRAAMKKCLPWLHATDNTPVPGAGAVLPLVKVTFHNVNDGEDKTNDLVYHAVSFRMTNPGADGADEAIIRFIGKICQTAAGLIATIGDVPAP